MEGIKIFVVNLIAAVCTFLSPITDFLTAAAILFGMNFFCGLLADVVRGNEWSWRKAFNFIVHCFIFFGLVTFIYMCGHFMHDDGGAVTCVSMVCYAAIYIYGVNIVRNMKLLSKEGSDMFLLLDFVYYVLTFKFCNKIPYWKEYADYSKRDGGDNDGGRE